MAVKSVADILASAASGAYDSGDDMDSSGSDSTQSSASDTSEQTSAASENTERQRASDGKFAKTDTNAAPPKAGTQGKAPPTVQTKGQLPDSKGVVDEGDIDPDKPETWKPTHRIPYDRFKSVTTERDSARSEAAKLQRQIEILQSQLLVSSRAQPSEQLHKSAEDRALEELWGTPQASQEQPWRSDLAPIQRELQELRNERALMQMDAAIADVRKQYPDVPHDHFVQQLALGAKDLRSIAEQKQEEINGYMQMGLTRSQAKQAADGQAPNAAPARDAPPRPRQTGSATGAGTGSKEGVNFSDSESRAKWIREQVKQRMQ